MKILGLFLSLILLLGEVALAKENSDAPLGHWFYYKKIYQGNEMPEPPEATLRLHYEFMADGSSKLYWWHEGEDDRCERRGRYFIEGDVIVEEAVWVNPENHPSCSKDPDMQEGKISRTQFEMLDGDLHLYIPFSDDFLIYVWKKIGL